MPQPSPLTLIGRSSSHFTRTARIFAAEVGVAYQFEIVYDLMSLDPSDFGHNPALKIPVLRTPESLWFGTLPVCRELHRRSTEDVCVFWPESAVEAVVSNAQELVLQAMATEVSLILAGLAGATKGTGPTLKLERSLQGSLSWLDAHWREIRAKLPAMCDLSFLETTTFCLIEHLEFREVLDVSEWRNLHEFRSEFASRPSAVSTPFRFDQPLPQ